MIYASSWRPMTPSLAVNHSVIDTTIAENCTTSAVTTIDDIEFWDWAWRTRSHSLWYCNDISKSPMLWIAVEKVLRKSCHDNMVSTDFFEGITTSKIQFMGFVSQHTKQGYLSSYHPVSVVFFRTDACSSSTVVVCTLTTRNHIQFNMQDRLLQLVQIYQYQAHKIKILMIISNELVGVDITLNLGWFFDDNLKWACWCWYNLEPRLVVPVGILRIPVFPAPVALFFHRNHDSCSAVTFLERHQETCLYGAYVESYVGYQFVRQKQSTIQFYGTLQWLLSTTIAAPPPPLLHHHCCAAATTATPIAVPPLRLPLLCHLSRHCTTIAVAVPSKPLLHHHCRCCAAIAVAAPPLPLLHHHLLCHCCAHCCAAIAVPPWWRQEMMSMETTTATTINDDSNNKGDADNNGDNGNNHNGNDNEATMTRPQQ